MGNWTVYNSFGAFFLRIFFLVKDVFFNPRLSVLRETALQLRLRCRAIQIVSMCGYSVLRYAISFGDQRFFPVFGFLIFPATMAFTRLNMDRSRAMIVVSCLQRSASRRSLYPGRWCKYSIYKE